MPNSINDLDKITLFPNPASQQLNFKSTNQPITQITIYDLEGRQLQNNNPNSFNTTININQLAGGIYVVRVSNKNGIQNFKFVKTN
jgi:hypothetical protein